MVLRHVVGLLGGGAALLYASLSQAQCAKDTDCKGERICERGQCVAPEPPASASGSATLAAAPLPVAEESARPERESTAAAPLASVSRPKMRRHSTGMMVGGIVMVALAPPALVVAGFSGLLKAGCNLSDDAAERNCDDSYDPVIYGSLLSAVVLVAVGVPLLVVGAKRVPAEPDAASAVVSPFLTRGGAGLGLRIDM